MFRRIRIVAEAREVVRPVMVCLVAIAVVACAMAIKGWHTATIALGLIMLGLAAVLIIEIHRAVSHLDRKSAVVSQAALEAESHYAEVLTRIIECVEARDTFWKGHSKTVGEMTGAVARKLGLPDDECERLALAGRLHDIGMLAIPDRILMNRGRLGTDEFRSLRKHSETSCLMLRPLQSMQDLLPAIRHHHERMNGTGYPDRKKGEEIPLGARIIAVADAYDAMTHDRPYRRALPALLAVQELKRCAPDAYDQRCVEAMAGIIGFADLERIATGSENRQPALA